MTPVHFNEANCDCVPAPDDASAVGNIPGWSGRVERGPLEGAPLVICAWVPSAQELEELNAGNPVFISFIGGLSPHCLTTSFAQARSIQ